MMDEYNMEIPGVSTLCCAFLGLLPVLHCSLCLFSGRLFFEDLLSIFQSRRLGISHLVKKVKISIVEGWVDT